MSRTSSGVNSALNLSSLFVDEETSRKYAQHRHRYSPELFQVITDHCRQAGNCFDLAVDIGCGPGNSTVGFAQYFKRVLGVDSSQTQVALAPDNLHNCDFKVSEAHNLQFIEDETVDLVCSGMAFHLMPVDETLAEINRVLKPGGTFAIVGHGPPSCTDKRMECFVNAAVSYLKPRVPKEFTPILNFYNNVEHPYSGAIRVPSVLVRHSMSLEGVLSVYELMQRMLSEFARPPDTHKMFMKEVKSRVTEFFPDMDERSAQDPCFEFTFDIAIILGSKSRD